MEAKWRQRSSGVIMGKAGRCMLSWSHALNHGRRPASARAGLPIIHRRGRHHDVPRGELPQLGAGASVQGR